MEYPIETGDVCIPARFPLPECSENRILGPGGRDPQRRQVPTVSAIVCVRQAQPCVNFRLGRALPQHERGFASYLGIWIPYQRDCPGDWIQAVHSSNAEGEDSVSRVVGNESLVEHFPARVTQAC